MDKPKKTWSNDYSLARFADYVAPNGKRGRAFITTDDWKYPKSFTVDLPVRRKRVKYNVIPKEAHYYRQIRQVFGILEYYYFTKREIIMMPDGANFLPIWSDQLVKLDDYVEIINHEIVR